MHLAFYTKFYAGPKNYSNHEKTLKIFGFFITIAFCFVIECMLAIYILNWKYTVLIYDSTYGRNKLREYLPVSCKQ